MNKHVAIPVAVVCFVFLGVISSAVAQSAAATGEFTLQGRLTSTAGSAIADGQHTLVAKVYDAASGQVSFTETDNVMTSDGIFSVLVGANGEGGSKLHVMANSDYELGISIDGQSELSPKITLGGSLKSITADLAANANAVGGFGVSTGDSAKANTVLVLNGSGKINTSLLDGGIVTSINGASGSLTLQGGGDLSVNTTGNTVSLSFNGSGALNFPFSKTLSLASGTGFSISNSMAATAASFINTGIGAALQAQSTTGSAISASSSGSGTGAATIDVQNSGGAAINAVASASSDAVVKLKNTSSNASAKLMTASDASGTAVLDVAANGKTTINSSVGDALDVTSSATGEAALKITGGLKLVGPAGSGQINLGQTQVTISNALANANSIILVTVNGAGGLAVPLQVLSQGNGNFVVAVVSGLTAVTGNVKFSYLVINQ